MTKALPKEGGIELIVYQIGELKDSVTTGFTRMDANQDKIDKRVTAIEIWQAGQIEKDREEARRRVAANSLLGIDVGKIVIAAIGVVATALAIVAGRNNGY